MGLADDRGSKNSIMCPGRTARRAISPLMDVSTSCNDRERARASVGAVSVMFSDWPTRETLIPLARFCKECAPASSVEAVSSSVAGVVAQMLD